MDRKLIIPGFWLKLKVSWWRLLRKLKRRKPEIAWHGIMKSGYVNNHD